MSNVPDLVRSYAAGLEWPRGSVALTARTIREADSDLLPHDPVGRNLSTTVLPNHANNLLFGIAVGDPIARVAHLVRAYRDAPWSRPLSEIIGETEPRQPILGGQTLGLDLDGLVNLLARPSENERRWRRVGPGRFRVSLVVGEALLAKVEDLVDGRVDLYKPHDPDAVGGQTFRLLGQERETTPFQRWAHLEFAHFDIAAALWADSLKHGAVYTPSLLDSSDDEPETETAAQGPGKDQNAAAVSDQTAGTVLDGPSQTHPTSEREKSQLPRVKRSGRSSPMRRMIHDRTDPHAAVAALACAD